MKKLVFFIFLISLIGCEDLLTTFRNPCAIDRAKEGIKLSVSLYAWYVNNPIGSSLELYLTLLGFAFSDRAVERVENWALSKFGETAKRVNILDISKPEKSGEKKYRCSAIAELDGKRYGVVYTVEKLHSGKEDYYDMQAEEIFRISEVK